MLMEGGTADSANHLLSGGTLRELIIRALNAESCTLLR